MKIDLTIDAEKDDALIVLTKINAALKNYGGYVDGYLQLVPCNILADATKLDYAFRIVRTEEAMAKDGAKKR